MFSTIHVERFLYHLLVASHSFPLTSRRPIAAPTRVASLAPFAAGLASPVGFFAAAGAGAASSSNAPNGLAEKDILARCRPTPYVWIHADDAKAAAHCRARFRVVVGNARGGRGDADAAETCSRTSERARTSRGVRRVVERVVERDRERRCRRFHRCAHR